MEMDTFFASSKDIFVAQPEMIKVINKNKTMNLTEYLCDI